MFPELTLQYRPAWAKHVEGRYSQAMLVDGERVPQFVEMKCEVCGDARRATCHQGMPRSHITKFAQEHLHRAPMAPIKP